MSTLGITRRKAPAHLRWASLLLILMLLVTPGMALAAPAAQELDIVGTWESTVSQEGETVTISLFDDLTVSGLSTYADNDDQIIYGGSWEVTGEDTFVLYIETVDGVAADEPVEFTGIVTRRGIRLPDAPDWGRNGMSLTFIDENPTDFSAGAIEEEPVEEDPIVPTEGSLAGAYASEPILDEENNGATNIYITLFDDGTMETLSTYEGDDGSDSSFETGNWVDNGDGTVTITFVTIDGEDYDPPVDLDFTIEDDGSLRAPTLTAFGENGLHVFPSGEEVVPTPVDDPEVDDSSLAGLYASAPVISSEGVVGGVMIYLSEDGSAQAIITVFDAFSVPEMAVGQWTDNGDGTVTLALTGTLLIDSFAETTELEEMTTPDTTVFTLEDGALIHSDVSLYPAGPASADSADDEGLGEEVIDEGDDDTGNLGESDSVIFISPLDVIMGGTTASLILLEDGTATLAVTSSTGETIAEMGTWVGSDDDGSLTLELTLSVDGEPLEEPTTIDFIFDEGTDTLIPADDYDTDRYGPDLTLEMVSE